MPWVCCEHKHKGNPKGKHKGKHRGNPNEKYNGNPKRKQKGNPKGKHKGNVFKYFELIIWNKLLSKILKIIWNF